MSEISRHGTEIVMHLEVINDWTPGLFTAKAGRALTETVAIVKNCGPLFGSHMENGGCDIYRQAGTWMDFSACGPIEAIVNSLP